MGKRTGQKKRTGRPSTAGTRPEVLGPPIPVPDPVVPSGYRFGSPDVEESETLAELLRQADPQNPHGTWSGMPQIIADDQDPAALATRIVVAATTGTDDIAGAVVTRPPLTWGHHPLLVDAAVRDIFMRNIAVIDSLAVHDKHRGQGIARALVTQAEQLLSDEGFPLVLVIHRPELTDFYARLGYRHEHGGLAIASGEFAIAQPWPTGYSGSWKPLREGVALRTVPVDCGPWPVIIGVFTGSAAWERRQRANPPADTATPPWKRH